MMDGGHKKWFLLAFTLLLIIVAFVAVPVILTIIHSRRVQLNKNEPEMTTGVTEIIKIMPPETIVFTVSTAEGRKQKKNETERILYKDKILTSVEKLVERNDNPCVTYIIEEFSDKAAFSKLLSKTEVICELEKIFQDLKPTSDINITNAIESFRKLPWSSQITNIFFVPNAAMYRSRKMYKNDMKSANDLLKQMVNEDPTSSPRIIIGDPAYFQNIDCPVSMYSSNMNADDLTEAILLALQTEEFKTPENSFTSIASIKEAAPEDTSKNLTDSRNTIVTQQNIDSTTTLFNTPVTVTESRECPPPRIFVSYPTSESEVTSSISTTIHQDSQSLGKISKPKSANKFVPYATAKEILTDVSDIATLPTLITAKTDDPEIDQETTFPITFVLPLYSTLAKETITSSGKDSQNMFLQTTSHISMVATETVTKHFTYSTEISIPEPVETTNDKSKVSDGLTTLIIPPLTVNHASSITENPPIISA